jgi:XTP/dITP diphosphohydrolase
VELKLITSNRHKFEEMNQKLKGVVDLSLYNQAYPEIQADTALDIARNSLTTLVPLIDGNFCIEDSGISVEALKGFPGPYSSYVYRTIGWQGILDLMAQNPQRNATFVSVIGLYWKGDIHMFQGSCEGTLTFEGKGDQGFGFDPIFVPDGHQLTFAELDMETKNQVSHRSRSTQLLADFLRK